MSSADTITTAGATARAAQSLIAGVTAQLTGRPRGPDHSDDKDYRVPRKHSYEVSDLKAQPWHKIGDGSVLQGIMHKEALVDAAEALRLQLREEYPAREARVRRRDRADRVAELEALMQRSPAEVPTGLPASLRIQIDADDEWLARADGRLRRIDLDVLRGLLHFLTDFVTGRLFPTHETIAEQAGVHRNSVVAAMPRLRAHGLLHWVRRTVRTGNTNEFGPQLEQTSNGYEIAPRRLMATRTWQTYWMRLCTKLARLGPKRPPPAAAAPPPAAPLTPLQRAIVDLGISVVNAST